VDLGWQAGPSSVRGLVVADIEDEQSFADDLSDSIDRLIQDLLARRGGGFSEGFVFWVNYTDKDGETNFAFGTPEGQRIATTSGIAACISKETDLQLYRALRNDDD
jgi:hypothetical protein